MGRCGRAARARRGGRGCGIRDRSVGRNPTRRLRPCGRTRQAHRAWCAATWRRWRSPKAAAAAQSRLQRRAGCAHTLADWWAALCCSTFGPPGASPAKEMPALDALEAKLGGQSLRSSPSTSTPATRQAAHLAQGRRHHAARLLRRSERQGVSGLPLVGRPSHANDAYRRSRRLRDRHGGGPSRMGGRGCRQAHEHGARASILNGNR